LPSLPLPRASARGLVTASLVLAVLLVPAAATGAGAAKRVTVGDNYFVRSSGVPTVTVGKGTKVTWVWRGQSRHNVKVAKGPARFGSNTMRSGTYSKVVRRTGTYTIVCTVHGPDDQKMKLVVVR
jgi:plastocyanin